MSPGLGSIKEVPILMTVAGSDDSCTVELAQEAKDEIGGAVRSFRVLKDAEHEIFWNGIRSDVVLEEIRH